MKYTPLPINVGDVFGQYTVIGDAIKPYGRHKRFACQCSCGTTKDVLAFTLRSGESWHCGCKTSEVCRAKWDKKSEHDKAAWKQKCNNTKHNGHKTREYSIWSDMKSRCLNKHHAWFPQYGARGIDVCEEWANTFDSFIRDMGLAPTTKHQLDRINNDLGYNKQNCRWATPTVNQRNKRNARLVSTPTGEAMQITYASEKFGLSVGCIKHRIKVGWPVDKVFSTPSQRNQPKEQA